MQKVLSLLARKVKPWIRQHNAVDVIMFGSTMRGNAEPNDIDMCILIDNHDEDKSLDLVGSLGSLAEFIGIKPHISILTFGSFISGNTLAKTLLEEGYSVNDGKRFSGVFGFRNKSLFVYSLRKFTSSDRVRFHYLLKGRRGSDGLLKEVGGEFLGTGSILVPAEKEDALREVFDKWKVGYKIEKVLFG